MKGVFVRSGNMDTDVDKDMETDMGTEIDTGMDSDAWYGQGHFHCSRIYLH